MKKLFVLLASFALSTGVTLANPNLSDCDDDLQPIVISMNQD